MYAAILQQGLTQCIICINTLSHKLISKVKRDNLILNWFDWIFMLLSRRYYILRLFPSCLSALEVKIISYIGKYVCEMCRISVTSC